MNQDWNEKDYAKHRYWEGLISGHRPTFFHSLWNIHILRPTNTDHRELFWQNFQFSLCIWLLFKVNTDIFLIDEMSFFNKHIFFDKKKNLFNRA